MWEKVKPTLAAIARSRLTLVALVGLAVILYLRFAPALPPIFQPAPSAVQVAAKPRVVETVRTVTVPGPERIVYIDRVKVEEKLKWAPSIAPDNVLAVAEIPPHTGKTTAIATASVDNGTLSSRIIYRQEATKFLDLKREVALYGAFGSWGGVEAGATLRPLRIGPVETFGTGRVRTDRDGAIKAEGLIGIEYRF